MKKPKIYDYLSNEDKKRMDKILRVNEYDLYGTESSFEQIRIASNFRRQRYLTKLDKMKNNYPVAHKTAAKKKVASLVTTSCHLNPDNRDEWDDAQKKVKKFHQ